MLIDGTGHGAQGTEHGANKTKKIHLDPGERRAEGIKKRAEFLH
ncbi:MAG TPA: hypothetical protein PK094_03185 [Bacteroidales bacterium]|nr:hypothetical protein [Bacteroidales bacterium]